MNKKEIIHSCRNLLFAYKNGLLGDITMPEDTNPFSKFGTKEEKLSYFSLPMSLNYQRNSYKLWESALETWKDSDTHSVFNLEDIKETDTKHIKEKLLKYKLALQPNKHIDTWKRIGTTIFDNWGSFEGMIKATDYDFLKLRNLIQKDFKKGFPYLSGPKIFNYWSYIIQQYCDIELKNSKYIEIAPDTHVIQASVRLGIITEKETMNISREKLSNMWRETLKDSGINPIEMHSPLWFWSRNGFKYKV